MMSPDPTQMQVCPAGQVVTVLPPLSWQVVPVAQSVETVHGGSQLVPTSRLCPPETKLVPKVMHVSLTALWANIVYLNVTSPRLNTDPPPGSATLSLIVTLMSVAWPASCINA